MISIQHIHPMLVHFPIVFVLTLALFDVIAAVRRRSVTTRSTAGAISTGLAVLSGAFAVVTFYFGGMALDYAEASGFHSEIAEIHEGLGTTTAIAFGLWALIRLFLWWRDHELKGPVAALVPILEVAGAVVVLATAYYGGQLVYDLGVNVAHAAAS
jgi:uncharacterized membrane protein